MSKNGPKVKTGRKGEPILSPMKATFARKIFEGMTYTEAYAAAGYARDRESKTRHTAHNLANSPEVKKEVMRLQNAMIAKSTWDAFRVFKEYTELFNVAKGEDGLFLDRPTALRCLEMISKFIGMHVERRELTLKLGSPSDDPKVLDDQITQLARLVGREDIIPLIELDPSQVVDVSEKKDALYSVKESEDNNGEAAGVQGVEI